MSETVIIVLAVVVAVVGGTVVVLAERWRRNHALARRLKPFNRTRYGGAQVIDPDDYPSQDLSGPHRHR